MITLIMYEKVGGAKEVIKNVRADRYIVISEGKGILNKD